MYGLKQVGILAYTYLKQFLATFEFYPVKYTHGLWKHETRPIMFTLTVDDFGVKYEHVSDVQYLLTALQQRYEVVTDWTGTRYCGITL